MYVHPSHITRFSDSSLYDEKCVNCGATDAYSGTLDRPCSSPGDPYKTEEEYRAAASAAYRDWLNSAKS